MQSLTTAVRPFELLATAIHDAFPDNAEAILQDNLLVIASTHSTAGDEIARVGSWVLASMAKTGNINNAIRHDLACATTLDQWDNIIRTDVLPFLKNNGF